MASLLTIIPRAAPRRAGQHQCARTTGREISALVMGPTECQREGTAASPSRLEQPDESRTGTLTARKRAVSSSTVSSRPTCDGEE